VLRKMLGPKREDMMGGWSKSRNEKLDLYSSLDIIRVSKKGRCNGQGAWHVWGEGKYTFFWGESMKEQDKLEDMDADRR
jgi:hypothetical protein